MANLSIGREAGRCKFRIWEELLSRNEGCCTDCKQQATTQPLQHGGAAATNSQTLRGSTESNSTRNKSARWAITNGNIRSNYHLKYCHNREHDVLSEIQRRIMRNWRIRMRSEQWSSSRVKYLRTRATRLPCSALIGLYSPFEGTSCPGSRIMGGANDRYGVVAKKCSFATL